MKELLDSLAINFDDAEGWIRLVNAEWIAKDLHLNLSIQFANEQPSELWEVICASVVEESLCSNGTAFLDVSTDSDLLKPFLEPEIDIMFSQNSLSPEALFGIVCSCCIEEMGRPESIARFINAAPTMSGISSSSYGLLGRFPASLATRILAALADKPININTLPGRRRTRWDGSKHVEYQQLQALEFGRSYVVAKEFSAFRASKPASDHKENLPV